MSKALFYTLNGVNVILSLIGLYYLGEKKKIAFILILVCNIVGFVIMLSTDPIVISGVIMNLIYIPFNIRNYYCWKKDEKGRIDL